jgi:acyl carrier protein
MSKVKNRAEIARDVDRLIRSRLPSSLRGITLTEGMSLLDEGLGLDSIALVELFLKLEDYFGISITADLIDKGPLTAGGIIDHIFNCLGCFSS